MTERDDDSLFGDVIHAYTREDALEDGVLIDATLEPWGELSGQIWPGTDVVMTRGLHALIEAAVASEDALNDRRGVWWDILFMSRTMPEGEGATRLFPVVIRGTEGSDEKTLKVVASGEGRWEDPQGRPLAITYMLEHED